MRQKTLILLIDDSLLSCHHFMEILEDENYLVEHVLNGDEGIKKAKELVPDMILLDIVMPDFDGYEVCRRIRSTIEIADIPIIMFTEIDDNTARLRGFEAGADDFIHKSITRDEFLLRIKSFNRIKRNQQLHIERLKYQQIIERSPDGILIINIIGAISFSNPAAIMMLSGKKKRTIIGDNIFSYIKKEQLEIFSSFIENVYNNQLRNSIGEFIFKNGDDVYFHAEVRSGYFSFQGTYSIQVMFRDISLDKLAEKEMLAAKQRAEEANRLKTELYTNVSHELRTPLNTIIGFSDLILTFDLERDVIMEQVKKILVSGKNLLTIINNLLDISEIESTRRINVEKNEIVIRKLIEEVIAYLNVSYQNKEISIETQINNSLDIQVISDYKKLFQILVNIVGNSIKFTQKGKIVISVEIDDREETLLENEIKLFFKIVDTGIGIPKSRIKTIFNPFVQADTSNTRQFGGAGLGLSVSKRFVEILNGNIWIESAENEGTSLFFTVPVEMKDEEKIEKGDQNNEKKVIKQQKRFSKTIMIVEDDTTNVALLKAMLNKLGYRYEIASNGKEALKIIDRVRPDMILMDVQLPIMDGIEATRKIRYHNKYRDLPIVAITSHANDEEKDIYLNRGFNVFLTKPIDMKRLKTILSEYFNE